MTHNNSNVTPRMSETWQERLSYPLPYWTLDEEIATHIEGRSELQTPQQKAYAAIDCLAIVSRRSIDYTPKNLTSSFESAEAVKALAMLREHFFKGTEKVLDRRLIMDVLGQAVKALAINIEEPLDYQTICAIALRPTDNEEQWGHSEMAHYLYTVHKPQVKDGGDIQIASAINMALIAQNDIAFKHAVVVLASARDHGLTQQEIITAIDCSDPAMIHRRERAFLAYCLIAIRHFQNSGEQRMDMNDTNILTYALQYFSLDYSRELNNQDIDRILLNPHKIASDVLDKPWAPGRS